MKNNNHPEGNRHRFRPWIITALAVVILPWIGVASLAYEVVPGSIALTDRLFAVALIATYFGLWACAIFVGRNGRLMLIRALGTTVILVLIVLILELPAALKWVHWTVIFRGLTGEGRDYGTTYVLDQELSFRRIPKLSWTGRPASDLESGYGLPRSLTQPITFTFDRWGYRNATEMERADIVLLGDSYVEGWYVSDEQTIATQLATQIGQSVASLGVAGYGTMQELRVLQRDALSRKPRAVVWFFFEGNDLYDDQNFENFLSAEPPGPEQTMPRSEGLTLGHGWKTRSFVRNAFRWLRRWSHPVLPNRAPYWAFFPGRGDSLQRVYFSDYGALRWTEYEENRWAKATAAFQVGIKFTRDRGIDLLFVYIPTKYRVYRSFIEVPEGSPMETWGAWALQEKFHDFCAEAAVSCIDLTGDLERAVEEGGMPYALNDTHWNAEGHAVAATVLDREFRNLGWVPPTR